MVAPVPVGGPLQGSGRAAYRGGAREPHPGMGDRDIPVQEMAQMNIGAGNDGAQAAEAGGSQDRRAQARERRVRQYYAEPRTRPEHVTDKQGMLFKK